MANFAVGNVFEEERFQDHRFPQFGVVNQIYLALAAKVKNDHQRWEDVREEILEYVNQQQNIIFAGSRSITRAFLMFAADFDNVNLVQEETLTAASELYHLNICFVNDQGVRVRVIPTDYRHPDQQTIFVREVNEHLVLQLRMANVLPIFDENVVNEVLEDNGQVQTEENAEVAAHNEDEIEPEPMNNGNNAGPARVGQGSPLPEQAVVITPNNRTPVIGKVDYNRIAKGVFKDGRINVDILIFVPIRDGPESLADALRAIPNDRLEKYIYVCCDYYEFRLDALADELIQEHYTVYSWKNHIPQEYMQDRKYKWFMKIMVVPLILSVIKFQWRGIQVNSYCKSSTNSMMDRLLNVMWQSEGVDIIDDIADIRANPDIYICENCTHQCENRLRQWHLKLDMFCKLSSNPAQLLGRKDFVGRFNVLTFHGRITSNIINKLRNLWTLDINSPEPVYEALFHNVHTSNTIYYTYLVVVLDGERIEQYCTDQMTDLIKRPNLKKSIYAGFSTNEPFRLSHFDGIWSKLNRIFTRTARMGFLRSRDFDNFLQARRDEGILIDIVKGKTLQYIRESLSPRPFYLVNINSSQSFLLGLSEEDQGWIVDFLNRDIPVIFDENNPPIQYDNPIFTGNYIVGPEIFMKDGEYKEREFMSLDVQAEYGKIRKWVPR